VEAKEEPTEIHGDLGGDKETISLRFIRPQGQSGRVEPDRTSPILVLRTVMFLFSTTEATVRNGSRLTRSTCLRAESPCRHPGRARLGRDARTRKSRPPRSSQFRLSLQQEGYHLVFRSPGINSGRFMEARPSLQGFRDNYTIDFILSEADL
jgi:hypothetical protein